MYSVNKYKPLENILCYDDFDKGLHGWMVLVPNIRADRMDYFPEHKKYAEWGPPMLSSATFGYAGTHGSMNGTYSMKLSSRPIAGPPTEPPVAGSTGHAIKRLTFLEKEYVKFEMWYAIKAEQDRPWNGENHIRGFGLVFDIQDEEKRYFCGARYMNAAGGKMQQRWQYASAVDVDDASWGDTAPSASDSEDGSENGKKIYIKPGVDPSWLGKRYADGGSDSFKDVPGGKQTLCYNESVDKINWHYFSLTVDMEKREYVELASINKRYDLRGCKPTLVDAYPRINQLLNPILWVEADTDRRVFLFVDSVLVSTGKRAAL
ncbi:MAG: hypothetical protein LBN21_07470 [Treponema sp.]|jgi:hypothetical protein|nr:hypothetical protein [Treponema sp.]